MVCKFIKLTSAPFRVPVYINVDYVSSVHTDFDKTNDTIVNMSFGQYRFYRVKESVETVLEYLSEAAQ